MLRGENIACGTSTTGTGTLTLAACPAAIGGLDPDTWLKATGVGFVSGSAVPVSYTIIEFFDNTFAKPIGMEKGVGVLTLGANIAAATLARTTLQQTGVIATPAYNVAPATAYSIVTAANTLVFVTPSAADTFGLHPYFNNEGDVNWGVLPDGLDHCTGTAAGISSTSTVRSWYQPFRWSVPMLVKRCSFRVQTFTAPTPASVVFVRIYAARASDGRPGKLLYDFTPSSGVSVTSTGNFNTGAAGNGFFLMPGDYWIEFCMNAQSTSGSIAMGVQAAPYQGSNPAMVRLGMSAGANIAGAFLTGTTGAAPDPAVVTGWGVLNFGSQFPVLFGLNPS